MPLDDAFWPALWDAALASGTRPEVLLAVWYAESGLDPSAKNSIGCIGLNQSCPTPYGPGFPNDDGAAYQAAPASAQVAWIKPQLLHLVALNGGGFASAARYRQANWLPATLATAKAPGDVVAAATGPYAVAYAANRELDVRNAGVVTVDDLGLGLEQLVTHHGAPLDVAIATAYAHRPDGAPWASPRLVLFEPNARRYRPLVLAISALGVALAVAGAHRRTA
jgi:hypothetical protein